MKRYMTCVSVFLLAGMLVSCGGGGGGDSASDGGSPGTTTAGNPTPANGGNPGTTTGGNTAPATGGDPAPATGGNTAPATGGDPAPTTGGNPTPATGGNPVPASGGNPAPVSGGDPAPATGGDPAPATGGNPAPVTGGDPAPTTGGNPGNASGGGTTPPSVTARFEESDTAAVSLSGEWTQSNPHAGWSGGAAVQSTVAGSTVSFTFTGTSVRWLGARGRGHGIALVKVDGAHAREVDLFARPNDELRTPAITLYDLGEGPHTLTIEVTGRKNQFATSNVVVVDAFDVQPEILSHIQEMDPDVTYSGTWAQADDHFQWSGSGAGNAGDPPVGAKVAETVGANVTLKFRGTSITWIGYRGPDGGIARVTVDGVESEVDTYSKTFKVQEVVFTKTGLPDTDHTLTIEATGRKNDASTAAKVFVDAFDVTTPGRRFEAGDPKNSDPAISFFGSWNHNVARVWTEGASATSNQTSATATFSFTGTGVSWIGCSKASAGGRAKIYLDDALVEEVSLGRKVGIEGYQRTIYRVDGLTSGQHKLRIEVTSTDRNYVVVDAFDVRP
jgi:hypothetical protein